jgi:hypothetical protein
MMKEFLCNPQHLYIAIGVLLLVIVLFGAGRGIGALIVPILKRLSGNKSNVTVNVSEGKKETPDCKIDPDNCPAHLAEKERSLRNQENIGKLFDKVDHLKECLSDGFRQIGQEIGTTKTEIIKALAAKK